MSDELETLRAQVDKLLSTPIPGGSQARDWFLPHDTDRGLENVRDVVRRLVAAGQAALLAKIRAGGAVAYFDIGHEGYVDIGSDLEENDVRQKLGAGKHLLFCLPDEGKVT